MCIRMQPCEAEYPIDAGFGVPWMPTPGADRPIQRVPSGLLGPGGIGFCPWAQREFGGYHHGFRHLTTIEKRPSGVGYTDWPVATRKLRRSCWKWYRSSRFEPRRITITERKVRRVVCAFSAFVLIRTHARLVARRRATMVRVSRSRSTVLPARSPTITGR